mgnify:CR=1 FL=1
MVPKWDGPDIPGRWVARVGSEAEGLVVDLVEEAAALVGAVPQGDGNPK